MRLCCLRPAPVGEGQPEDERGERKEGEEMEHMGDAAEYSAARLRALHVSCSVR